MIFMAISQHTRSQTEMHTFLWSVVQDSDLKQVSDAGRQSNLDKRDTSTVSFWDSAIPGQMAAKEQWNYTVRTFVNSSFYPSI